MQAHLSRTLLAAMTILVMFGCTAKEENLTLKTLQDAVSEGKYLYAHQDDLCYGHTWYGEMGRSDVKEVCGEYPAIVGFDLGGIELGNECNLDSVSFDYMREAALAHAGRGGIVTFSWHARNPLTGGDTWDVSSDKVVNSILEGGECHETFMLWLERAADFLESLKGEDGKVIPAIFRPWHENIGSWFWWGGDLCTQEEYQGLWDMTYSYMVDKRGLTTLVWAYSPNIDVDEEQYMSRYPGDGIIDILGCDGYQYSTVEAYKEQVRKTLSFIEGIASEKGKLMAMTETGHEGIPESDWWTGAMDDVLKDFPVSYVLTWRNAWNRPEHFYGPFPGAECAEDFKAFHDLDRTVFLSE